MKLIFEVHKRTKTKQRFFYQFIILRILLNQCLKKLHYMSVRTLEIDSDEFICVL